MKTVFVFGSNLAGRHGAGSAREAVLKWGAIYGQGTGRQGNSYAIPTKGFQLERLKLSAIKIHVEEFLDYAKGRPDTIFKVVAIGTGLAGYPPEAIAPMFKGNPVNVHLPVVFERILHRG